MISDQGQRDLSVLYSVILHFAGGKRYLMRAPLRLWAELYWEEEHPFESNSYGSDHATVGKRSTVKLNKKLKGLENQGRIRRFPGGIEIMENV